MQAAQPQALRYGVAVAATAVILLVSLAASPLVEPMPSIPFFSAVAISAWFGGFGPALVAAVLAVLAVDYFFVDPVYALNPEDPSDAISLVAFLLVAMVISYLNVHLRNARDRAEAAHAQAESAVRSRDDFIATVVHDLRTPLTSIKGYAQFMARGEPYNQRAVAVILQQADRMGRLLTDLGDVSQLSAGQLPLRRAQVDLVPLAQDSIDQAREPSSKHAIRLAAPKSPIEGWWDRDRLVQVLENLLANAIKYSPTGGEIMVRIESIGEEVQVSVQDQGPGIPREALPHLFDRFYRVEASARNTTGLGLGLYIAKSFVEAHGGRIWVESKGPGQGSTFAFTLPCRQAEANSDASGGGRVGLVRRGE